MGLQPLILRHSPAVKSCPSAYAKERRRSTFYDAAHACCFLLGELGVFQSLFQEGLGKSLSTRLTLLILCHLGCWKGLCLSTGDLLMLGAPCGPRKLWIS
eukprot:Blabericola_migrator_1__5795@NODE_2936_length_2191_cov_4_064030_g1841_i0_p1_GENE_NODE_2936_length_2191_cov_4_064030_g1841_i0NODE_2936_length_2191_cov_4_064030_g1841_i0_p1_ORF_typecomplete_len100_score0_77UL17/PF17640_2/33UL17/PF17640_2/28UL17/PF17640_2/1_1e03_NODE_2936_length_2191_cov_4_064030_g1841_i09671266